MHLKHQYLIYFRQTECNERLKQRKNERWAEAQWSSEVIKEEGVRKRQESKEDRERERDGEGQRKKEREMERSALFPRQL